MLDVSSVDPRRLATSILCAALAAWAGPVTAAPRFHLLTPRLAARLRAPTRAALRGVATLRSASGFVVHQDPGGRSLVLTNEHVTRGGVTAGGAVQLFDGATGKIVRVLATNATLDYSLIEVELPAAPDRSLPLSTEAPAAGAPIYALAAFANLGFPVMQAAVGGGAAPVAEIGRGAPNRFAIARGVADPAGSGRAYVQVPGGKVLGLGSMLPNAPGMSGSPVLDRATHRVIGLHSSGDAVPGSWQETSVPVGLILQDLGVHLRSGSFDPPAAAMVEALLKRSP